MHTVGQMICIAVSVTVISISAKVFTVEELIGLAIRNSRQLHYAAQNNKLTEISIQELYGSLFPQIRATMEIDHSNTRFTPCLLRNGDWAFSRFSQAKTGQTASRVTALDDLVFLPDNIFTASLTLTQPLFSQGKTLIGLKAARADQMLHLCKYEEEKSRVKRDAMKMFYKTLLEQQRAAIKKEFFTVAEEAHRLAKVNFRFAQARELDTLISMLQLERVRLELKQAESDRRMACESLIAYCGLAESPATFRVEGEFPEAVFFITIDEALAQLQKKNPRIRQFRGAEAIADGAISLAKAEYLPTLYVGGTVGRIGLFPVSEEIPDTRWSNDQRVFAGLSWTLFSGLVQGHRIERSKVEREQLLITQQKTVDELEHETRKLFELVMICKDRLHTAGIVIEIARKRMEIAKKSHDIGSGTSFESQNAGLEYHDAELSYQEASYDFHCAATDFKFLIGSLE